MDLAANPRNVVLQCPRRIVRLEFTYIADPPNMVTHAIRLGIGVVHRLPRDLFADSDGLHHRAIAEPRSAHVVNFAAARIPEENGRRR